LKYRQELREPGVKMHRALGKHSTLKSRQKYRGMMTGKAPGKKPEEK